MVTLEQAKAAMAAHSAVISALPFVEGVGVSAIDGEHVLLVFINRKPLPSEWLPTYVDGVRVVPRLTGKFQAL